MKFCIVMPLLLVIALASFAQDLPPALRGADDDAGIRDVMAKLQRASEEQDAELYASVFAPDATWEGLAGEQVSGPADIQSAMQSLSSRVGPLKTDKWLVVKAPSPTTKVVALYRKHGVPTSVFDMQIGGEVRTILHLEKRDGHWWATSARLDTTPRTYIYQPLSR